MTKTHSNRMKNLAVGAAMTLALVLSGAATTVMMPSAASAAVTTTKVAVWHADADVMVAPVAHTVTDNMVGQFHRFGDDVVGTC
jgi:hypothetical protein